MLISDHLVSSIRSNAGKMQLDISNRQINQLDTYIQENLHWIDKHNVSGLRSVEQVVDEGIIDTMGLIPYLHGKTVLDIGSGSGLPGLILAILCPGLKVCLTEKRSKKIAFLKRACRSCGIADRVRVVDARRQDPGRQFDCITARAFSDLSSTLDLCRTHLRRQGSVILPRSARDAEQCLVMGANVVMYPHDGKKVEKRLIAIFR
jgi:16S rRNA (guanine527-N7)-methyltransferase